MYAIKLNLGDITAALLRLKSGQCESSVLRMVVFPLAWAYSFCVGEYRSTALE